MLGERIKELRLERNLNQVELAHKLSCSKQAVSNWENNNILPSIEVLKKIALFFNCTTDYLLELDDKRKYLEITTLTYEQICHIQQVINDMAELNRLTAYKKKKEKKE